MAKLKAHGVEVLRVSRERSTPDGNLTIWERKTIAYMSDGKRMSKLDVRFKPDRYDTAGRYHSYGWKLDGKLKAEAFTRERMTEQRDRYATGVLKDGTMRVEFDGIAAFFDSRDRNA